MAKSLHPNPMLEQRFRSSAPREQRLETGYYVAANGYRHVLALLHASAFEGHGNHDPLGLGLNVGHRDL
jgi:hypothetical protein